MVELMSFLSLVTNKDKSVPPLSNCELIFFLRIFFNSET